MVKLSETSYERGYRQGSSGTAVGNTSSPGSSSGGIFTRRFGPLPVWGWMAVALLAAVGYYMWHKNQNASATASSATSTGTTGTTNDSLIPQFVNQVYTNPSPPTEPSPTGGSTGSPPPATSTVTVEDVVGESLESGQDDLQGLGLKVKGFNFSPSNAPKGSVRIITAQTPKAGTKVPAGTTITLTGKTQAPSKKTTTTKKKA